MQKLIVKTAVKSVLILLGVIVGAFAIFNFAFPQHMATAMETLGNYDMAVKYANLRYFYTQDSFDLARCYDDSVLAEDNNSVVHYGETLLKDKNYKAVCAERNALYNDMYSDQFGFNFDYDLRVRSTMAAAYYGEAIEKEGEERTKYTDNAIQFALDTNGTNRFSYGNALMSLSVKIVNNKDAYAAQAMLTALESVNPTDSKEAEDLVYFKSKLRGV